MASLDDNQSGANLAEVILTTLGSIASLCGGVFILTCYIILPLRTHFRHALIINLAVSDFINALNNTVSGLYIWTRGHDIALGPGCTANGIIGQVSVQATDCSILLIAVVTLANIRRSTFLSEATTLQKVLLCLSTWVLPFITGFTALGLNIYVPVDGNWCWIEESPTYMRYVLNHMWRFLVIVLSSAIYIYIYFYLRKRFSSLRMLRQSDGSVISSRGPLSRRRGHEKLSGGTELQDTEPIIPRNQITKNTTVDVQFSSDQDMVATKAETFRQSSRMMSGTDGHYQRGIDNQLDMTMRRIKKTLLLNGYPIAYIILWLPGLANRIAEATGHPVMALGIMQASTQLVGLANAITYGVNERMIRQLRDHFSRGGSSADTERRVMGQMA